MAMISQNNKLKPIQTIHIAFSAAIVVFATVALLTVKNRIYFDGSLDQDNGIYPLFPILGIIAIVTGTLLYKKQITAIENAEVFDTKFMKYQTAFLIRCAFIEAGALMNTVGFLVTANAVFLVVTTLALIFLVWFRPTKNSVTEELNLQYPDTEKLD